MLWADFSAHAVAFPAFFSAHVIIFDMLWADFSAHLGASPVIFSAHVIIFDMLWADFSAHSGASPVIFSAHVIIFDILWTDFSARSDAFLAFILPTALYLACPRPVSYTHLWNNFPCEGDSPTVEEVIAYLAEKLSKEI